MDTTKIIESLAKQVRLYLESKPIINYSLLGGDFGAICFLYYYSRTDSSYQSYADELLQRMFDTIPYQRLRPTYCDGLAGLCIGLKVLEKDGFVDGIDSSLDEFDHVLYQSLSQHIKINNIDFLHGIIGMGFYFAMRCKQGYLDHNSDAINSIVDY